MEEKPKLVRDGGKGPTRQVAADLIDDKPQEGRMLPVWFFIGAILLTYGIMIFASGIYELFHPPSTVLAELHAPIWWGAILAIVGAVYVYLFKPGKS